MFWPAICAGQGQQGSSEVSSTTPDSPNDLISQLQEIIAEGKTITEGYSDTEQANIGNDYNGQLNAYLLKSIRKLQDVLPNYHDYLTTSQREQALLLQENNWVAKEKQAITPLYNTDSSGNSLPQRFDIGAIDGLSDPHVAWNNRDDIFCAAWVDWSGNVWAQLFNGYKSNGAANWGKTIGDPVLVYRAREITDRRYNPAAVSTAGGGSISGVCEPATSVGTADTDCQYCRPSAITYTAKAKQVDVAFYNGTNSQDDAFMIVWSVYRKVCSRVYGSNLTFDVVGSRFFIDYAYSWLERIMIRGQLINNRGEILGYNNANCTDAEAYSTKCGDRTPEGRNDENPEGRLLYPATTGSTSGAGTFDARWHPYESQAGEWDVDIATNSTRQEIIVAFPRFASGFLSLGAATSVASLPILGLPSQGISFLRLTVSPGSNATYGYDNYINRMATDVSRYMFTTATSSPSNKMNCMDILPPKIAAVDVNNNCSYVVTWGSCFYTVWVPGASTPTFSGLTYQVYYRLYAGVLTNSASFYGGYGAPSINQTDYQYITASPQSWNSSSDIYMQYEIDCDRQTVPSTGNETVGGSKDCVVLFTTKQLRGVNTDVKVAYLYADKYGSGFGSLGFVTGLNDENNYILFNDTGATGPTDDVTGIVEQKEPCVVMTNTRNDEAFTSYGQSKYGDKRVFALISEYDRSTAADTNFKGEYRVVARVCGFFRGQSVPTNSTFISPKFNVLTAGNNDVGWSHNRLPTSSAATNRALISSFPASGDQFHFPQAIRATITDFGGTAAEDLSYACVVMQNQVAPAYKCEGRFLAIPVPASPTPLPASGAPNEPLPWLVADTLKYQYTVGATYTTVDAALSGTIAQIATANTFASATILYDSYMVTANQKNISTDLHNIRMSDSSYAEGQETAPSTRLSTGTTYYWRMAYRGYGYGWSDWSTPTSASLTPASAGLYYPIGGYTGNLPRPGPNDEASIVGVVANADNDPYGCSTESADIASSIGYTGAGVSDFTDTDGDYHHSSAWQVHILGGSFDNPAIDLVSRSQLLSLNMGNVLTKDKLLTPNQIYFYRVKYRDSYGSNETNNATAGGLGWSAWSPVRCFRTVTNLAPYTPQAVGPGNGVTVRWMHAPADTYYQTINNNTTGINLEDPNLFWLQVRLPTGAEVGGSESGTSFVFDPNDGSPDYDYLASTHWQVASDSGFSNIIWDYIDNDTAGWYDANEPGYTYTDATASCTTGCRYMGKSQDAYIRVPASLLNLAPGSTYYWHAAFIDNHGTQGPYSTTRTFVTQSFTTNNFLGCNAVSTTSTNAQTGVTDAADADGDGLCNYDEIVAARSLRRLQDSIDLLEPTGRETTADYLQNTMLAFAIDLAPEQGYLSGSGSTAVWYPKSFSYVGVKLEGVYTGASSCVTAGSGSFVPGSATNSNSVWYSRVEQAVPDTWRMDFRTGFTKFVVSGPDAGFCAKIRVFMPYYSSLNKLYYTYGTINGVSGMRNISQVKKQRNNANEEAYYIDLRLRDGYQSEGDIDGAMNSSITHVGGVMTVPGCFVATAAYGREDEYFTDQLHAFRDRYLLNSYTGLAFVTLYYDYSATIADFIAAHPFLRAISRIALWPAVAVAYALVHTEGLAQVAGIWLLLVSLTVILARRIKPLGRGR